MLEKDLKSIQSQATGIFLQKTGFNKHFPRAVVFGPTIMGGLDFRDLSIEQGISGISTLLCHVYHNSVPGKMIRIALANLQMEAGTGGDVMYETLPKLTYISDCWLKMIREFLQRHNLQLQIAGTWNFKAIRENDAFLMDVFRVSGRFSPAEMKNLNAVRLHLKVATVSDITTADGKCMEASALAGFSIKTRQSSMSWIRQPKVTSLQRSLWTRALARNFLVNSDFHYDSREDSDTMRKLRQPLGIWKGMSHQEWMYYYDPDSDYLVSKVSTNTVRAHKRIHDQIASTRGKQVFKKTFRIIHGFKGNLTPADNISCDPSDTWIEAKIDTRHKPSQETSQAQGKKDTVAEYIAALPKERQRFLAWCRPSNNKTQDQAMNLISGAIREKKTFEIAPDGGLSESIGTFGAVLAQGIHELWEIAGPVDCNHDTANSKRSELAGYTASLELLLMIIHFLGESTTRMSTKTWIDSSSAGQHISNMLQTKKTYGKYPHDPDLLAHIRWLWAKLPTVDHSIGWVKSHQDRDVLYKDLPRNAQLNTIADRLATEYYEQTKKGPLCPKGNPQFFPASHSSKSNKSDRKWTTHHLISQRGDQISCYRHQPSQVLSNT
jgi:hypothetical protein